MFQPIIAAATKSDSQSERVGLEGAPKAGEVLVENMVRTRRQQQAKETTSAPKTKRKRKQTQRMQESQQQTKRGKKVKRPFKPPGATKDGAVTKDSTSVSEDVDSTKDTTSVSEDVDSTKDATSVSEDGASTKDVTSASEDVAATKDATSVSEDGAITKDVTSAPEDGASTKDVTSASEDVAATKDVTSVSESEDGLTTKDTTSASEDVAATRDIPPVIPEVPNGFSTYEDMSRCKKVLWIRNNSVVELMQTFLINDPSAWTMKRLYQAMVSHYGVVHKRGANASTLGRNIDFPTFLVSDEEEVQTKNRWSSKLDMGRLLMIMFGDEQSRVDYIQSRQLATRQQLDNTTKKSVKVEYWMQVSKVYNSRDKEVWIEVGDDVVNMFLRERLKTCWRCDWCAQKLREQFRQLRADYEGSVELRNYQQSGQNSTEFYPDFQKGNPTHVLLHYLLLRMPHGGVLGNVPQKAAVDTNGDDKSYVDEDPITMHQRTLPSSSPSSAASLNRRSKKMQTSFQKVCETMLNSIEDMKKATKKSDTDTKKETSVDRSEHALRLVLTKRKIISTIEELKESGVDDDDDDIKLLLKSLSQVVQDIRSAL